MQSHCRNCNHVLTEAVKYCPNCAQKNTTGKVNVWTFLVEYFAKHFNLESRVFRSIRDLFIPGKLTLEYFKGRHKSYVHPLQLFFVLGLLLIASLAFALKDILNDANAVNINGVNLSGLKEINNLNEFTKEVDSLALIIKAHYNQSSTDSAIDSLRRALPKLNKANNFADTIRIPSLIGDLTNSKGERVKWIAVKDLSTLNADEIIKKYDIILFFQKLQFRQVLRILNDGKGFLSYMLGHTIWALMVAIPILALLFKLLHIRHYRYYVEHLVFGFHFHAFVFMLLLPVVLLMNILPKWLFPLLILTIFVYLFVAMLKYYEQGFLKTFVKYLAVVISYPIFLGVSLLAVTLITMFLF